MRHVSIVLAGFLGLLLVGCSTSFTAKKEGSPQQKVAQLETQVGTLQQRIEVLTQQQEALGQEIQTLQGGKVKQAASIEKGKAAQILTTRQIQQALAKAGFYQGTIDGKSGPKTKEAIKAFQQAQGLKADGVVGSKTSIALVKHLEE